MCTPWLFVGLGWLPIAVGVSLGLSFIIPYCIAVGLGHVSAGFPYISDTGTEPPESCIFGQLLNISSALAFATIYVRYKQVAEYYQDVPGRVLKCNKAGLVLGSLAALGMSIVANFQETNMIIFHLIGAMMCFGLGVLYGFTMTWISYKLSPQHCTMTMFRFRLALSALALVFLVTTLLFAGLASSQWDGADPRKWLPEDGGFGLHVASTASEWAMAVAFLFFFFTFIKEFQKVELAAEVRRCQRLINVIGDPSA
ncbi:DNA damage-regulated autophagy modulator protein 2-like [Acanthaster planci]|uniref:DNA damage-regulated autophagy modulator protein 2-like n=1 Tax=Acanthaster planci TaxID=133434 RepID=A0A8B7XS48_ACAPL|nr:DNA damage-regulated autophagy modulator protein 2-like [Acanthaster planci]XP_022082784.1 DNA damage-regulated autophagy modulator protein 2-like [Acanthaster planci]XP_022082785.1 DNA damage-regulated autophagy modulator protein 2-like [Acanthaster planci]XP_022082786.1 DNA damage-regulated autophagy modulator protein 2-like [Acanthaster planci]